MTDSGISTTISIRLRPAELELLKAWGTANERSVSGQIRWLIGQQQEREVAARDATR